MAFVRDLYDYFSTQIEFMQEIEAVYIEPPNEDRNVSGEGDANEKAPPISAVSLSAANVRCLTDKC